MASKRTKKKRSKAQRQCALCGRKIDFIGGEYIVGLTRNLVCANCLLAAKATLPAPPPAAVQCGNSILSPTELMLDLDHKIIGQSRAKQAVAVAMWKQQMRKKGFDLPNCGLLLYGPTGCGKTALVREAANLAGLPFLCFDATTLTETGYRGKDASDVLSELVDRYGREKARFGVVFLDEVDKLAAIKGNEYRAAYSRGTQHSLLKLLDGGAFMVDGDSFSTKDILFLFGGAFSGLRTELDAAQQAHPIGFQRCCAEAEPAATLTMDDLIHWGMEPELMGRIGRIVPLHPLDKEQLRRVLLHSDLSVYRRYQIAFARQGYTAELTEEEIDALIERAIALGLGARGLNALVEEAMEGKLLQWSEEIWK